MAAEIGDLQQAQDAEKAKRRAEAKEQARMAEEAESHAAALMKEANEQAKKTAEAQQHAKMFASKRLTAERLADEARLGRLNTEKGLAEARATLARAYENVLREFAASGQRRLRLLPISSGIFAGPMAAEIPALTWEALQLGFDALDPVAQVAVNN